MSKKKVEKVEKYSDKIDECVIKSRKNPNVNFNITSKKPPTKSPPRSPKIIFNTKSPPQFVPPNNILGDCPDIKYSFKNTIKTFKKIMEQWSSISIDNIKKQTYGKNVDLKDNNLFLYSLSYLMTPTINNEIQSSIIRKLSRDLLKISFITDFTFENIILFLETYNFVTSNNVNIFQNGLIIVFFNKSPTKYIVKKGQNDEINGNTPLIICFNDRFFPNLYNDDVNSIKTRIDKINVRIKDKSDKNYTIIEYNSDKNIEINATVNSTGAKIQNGGRRYSFKTRKNRGKYEK